ncbi:MAG: HEAT repeat domain-containing protein, partial [Candidatus Udaeobacter sp.]
AIEHKNPGVRIKALTVLAELRGEESNTYKLLLDRAKDDPVSYVRAEILDLLWKKGDSASRAFVTERAGADPDILVRTRAAHFNTEQPSLFDKQ